MRQIYRRSIERHPTLGKVLVADSDESIRDEIEKFLEPERHEVIHALDGAEAINLASLHVPDVAIVSLRIPVIDGMRVLEKIKTEPGTSGIPVIILTHSANLREKQSVAQFGALDYISKPWHPGVLETRVSWALRSKTSVPAVPWQLSDIEGQSKGAQERASGGAEVKSARKNRVADESEVEPQIDRDSTNLSRAKGGAVQTSDGEVQVHIPPNAIPVDLSLRAQKASSSAPAPSTLRVGLGETTADLSFADKSGHDVQGVSLKQPARIGIRYTAADVHDAGSEKNLRVKQFNSQTGQWEELPTSIDRRNRRAYADKQTFSAGVIRPEGTVLLVEEREREAEILTAALEGAGYDVQYETRPEFVLKRMLDEAPGILLLGLSMSRDDGFRVLRRIKSDPTARRIPVITIAPNGQADAYRGSIALGARDVIITPENMGDVQSRVARAYASARIRMNRARRAAQASAAKRDASRSAIRKNGAPEDGRKHAAAATPARRANSAPPDGARRARPAVVNPMEVKPTRGPNRIRRPA